MKKIPFYKFILIIFLLLIVVLAGVFLLLYSKYEETINFVYKSDSVSLFTVKEGDTLLTILPELERSGFIKNIDLLKIYIRLNPEIKQIKVGEYKLPTQFSFLELVDILSTGGFAPGVKITIKEGLRIELFAEEIEKKNNSSETKIESFDKNKFIELAKTSWINNLSEETKNLVLSIIPDSNRSLEGFLFPDTYEFGTDWNEVQILEKILKNFFEKIKTLNIQSEDYNKNVPNLYKAISLASIIEKEASLKDNKSDISSVFHNRLNINMLLQSDATVNYVTGKNDPGVLISDTQIDSPYNTYKYLGIPPGPINSPGLESIKAAIYPSKNDYFFFFHDNSGNVYFSKTFAEHNSKVMRIRGTSR